MNRTHIVLRALLAAVVSSACRDAAQPAPHGQPVASTDVPTSVIHYALAWSWEGTERDSLAGTWHTVNDLGYRVEIQGGYVVSYSMELVECANQTAGAPFDRLSGALWSVIEGTAHAGHGGAPNPAAMRALRVESLMNPISARSPRSRPAGAVTLGPQAYCQLHYLVARAPREAADLPAEVDMVDASLDLRGTYRASGSSADVPFRVHTAAAYGAMFDRFGPTTTLRVGADAGATTVVVRRYPARMFDGVDFAHMDAPVIASQILKAFVESAQVEIGDADDAA